MNTDVMLWLDISWVLIGLKQLSFLIKPPEEAFVKCWWKLFKAWDRSFTMRTWKHVNSAVIERLFSIPAKAALMSWSTWFLCWGNEWETKCKELPGCLSSKPGQWEESATEIPTEMYSTSPVNTVFLRMNVQQPRHYISFQRYCGNNTLLNIW